MGDSEVDDQKLEIEDQFILRLPQKQAEKVRQILNTKPKKIKKMLSIDLDADNKTGTVRINKKMFAAKLVNFPTIIESNKCYDKVHLFKTADVLQMLVCGDLMKGDSFEHPHGLAPPLKNVRKKRFRQMQRNKNVEVDEEEVEKELLWLLRMDNEAVSSKFEIFYEETNNNKENKDPNIINKREREIFGSVISDDSDQDSSGSVNDIIEYTN